MAHENNTLEGTFLLGIPNSAGIVHAVASYGNFSARFSVFLSDRIASARHSSPKDIINSLYTFYSNNRAAFKHWLENFDSDGSIEDKVDIAQKLYYLLAEASVIRSYFTPNGIKGSLGLIWMADQDFWNVISCIFAFVTLPRLYREAHSENANTKSTLKSALFLSTAIFFPFCLLPATLACLITSTLYAIDFGFLSVLFNSKKTLGKVFILFLGTLFYGIGMGICALNSISNFIDTRRQYAADIVEAGNLQAKNKKYTYAIGIVNIIRDFTCSLGALFGALSMYVFSGQFLFSSMMLYGASTVINASQGLHQLKKYSAWRTQNSPTLFSANEAAVRVTGIGNIQEDSEPRTPIRQEKEAGTSQLVSPGLTTDTNSGSSSPASRTGGDDWSLPPPWRFGTASPPP